MSSAAVALAASAIAVVVVLVLGGVRRGLVRICSWRNLRFWRWWWEERVSGQGKAAIAVTFAVALGIGGYLTAQRASAQEATTAATQRVITVVTKARANAPRAVVTKLQTVTQPGMTKVVTVRRRGRTVVVRAPAETVTTRGPIERREVTNAHADTVVRTKTSPGTTETVTRDGTQPPRTVTTATVTRDVTQPPGTVTETNTKEITATQEVTVTEEVTVTVTVHGKP